MHFCLSFPQTATTFYCISFIPLTQIAVKRDLTGLVLWEQIHQDTKIQSTLWINNNNGVDLSNMYPCFVTGPILEDKFLILQTLITLLNLPIF